jgi:CheY-like chemotaxis protein
MNKVILVLDDDPAIRELIQTLLEDTDCEGYGLSTTKHLLEAVERFKPLVIFIDILIRNPGAPTMEDRLNDGWQAAELIKGYAPHIPLVMFTASREAIREFKVTPRGSLFDAVLAKPFDVKELDAILDGICEAIS